MTQNKLPHIEHVEVEPGLAKESVIIGKHDQGDIFFIPVESLDDTDRNRIIRILKKPRVEQMPLWQTLYETTMGNGQNALEYFHQIARHRMPNGQVGPIREGIRSTFAAPPSQFEESEIKVPDEPSNQTSEPKQKAGPGRGHKSTKTSKSTK